MSVYRPIGFAYDWIAGRFDLSIVLRLVGGFMKASRTALLVGLLCSVLVVVLDLSPTQALSTSVFDGTTLTITQTVNDGDITIDNNGAGNAFRSTDGAGTVVHDVATNLVVNLLPNTINTLNLVLDNVHAGSITLNLGDGARTVNLAGTNNTMGSLSIMGGTGAQIVEVATVANLFVTGSLTIDLS